MALARVAVVVMGTANTVLVCLLLRRFGFLAVLGGGGLYASWSALAYTEQQPLLEPFLTLALLSALLLLRRARAYAHFLIGALLATAALVKVWAIADLVVLTVVIGAVHGARALWWVFAGTASAGVLFGIPFFLASPALMWEMVVLAQVGRPRDDVSLASRAAMFGPAPYVTAPVYVWAISLLMLGFLAICIGVLAYTAKRNGSHAHVDREPGLWALIALIHSVMLIASPSFYDHYAQFAAAPLSLSSSAAF